MSSGLRFLFILSLRCNFFMSPHGPLVLTLVLDGKTQHALNALRGKYFPAHRNHLGAHVTLFHAIPAHRLDELEGHLHHVCASVPSPGFDVRFSEPTRMGNRGVMLKIRQRPSGTIERVHRMLLSRLKDVTEDKDRLTNQDMMKLSRPHVTVLNKADSEEQVTSCLEELKATLDTIDGQALGLEM